MALSPGAVQRTGRGITILSVLAIGALTLRPSYGGPPPSVAGGYLATDIVLNLLLFLPLGIGLSLLGVRPLVAVAVGMLLSVSVELAQVWVIPGRDASVHDVVTNTAGTALAVLLARYWGSRAAWWRAGAPWCVAAVVLVWVGGSLLIHPAASSRGQWYSQWAYEFGGSRFSGSVLSLSLQDIPLRDGRLPQTDALRALLRSADTLRLTASILSGSRARGRSQIVAVVGGRGEEIVGVWQRGSSIRARIRLRVSDARLRNPWVSVPGALAGSGGDTLQLVVEATEKWLRLSVTGPGGMRVSTVPLSPDLFWAAFLPFDYAATPRNVWWPLLPAFPTLIVLGLAGRRRPGLGSLALAACLFLGPAVAGIGFPRWPIALAAVAGFGIGALLAGWLDL